MPAPASRPGLRHRQQGEHRAIRESAAGRSEPKGSAAGWWRGAGRQSAGCEHGRRAAFDAARSRRRCVSPARCVWSTFPIPSTPPRRAHRPNARRRTDRFERRADGLSRPGRGPAHLRHSPRASSFQTYRESATPPTMTRKPMNPSSICSTAALEQRELGQPSQIRGQNSRVCCIKSAVPKRCAQRARAREMGIKQLLFGDAADDPQKCCLVWQCLCLPCILCSGKRLKPPSGHRPEAPVEPQSVAAASISR